MTHANHKRWLKIAALVIGSFVPVFLLGSNLSMSESARLTLDLLSWPIKNVTAYVYSDTHFLSALTGGSCVAGASRYGVLQPESTT